MRANHARAHPWITGSYYRDAADEKFHDGWLRTGDVGMIGKLAVETVATNSD